MKRFSSESFRMVWIHELVIFITLILVQTECHNILAVFNIPSRSLHLAALSMSKILADGGHNVTVVTIFESDENKRNFTHIFLKDTAEIHKRANANFFDYDMNPYLMLYTLEAYGVENCKATFEDRAFKQLLKTNQKFDLLMIDSYMSNSLLYLSEHFNVPVVIYSSFDSGFPMNSLVGNPAPSSYIPHTFLHYSSEMTFFQRLNNAFFNMVNEILYNVYTLPKHDGIVKKHFPEAPDIDKYFFKASVILLNSDISIIHPVPQTPGIVYIGGYHINEPKPLPADLETIINNAENGVIIFSLGSNIKSSQMSKSRVQEILSIFSRLKETIIWKWEDEEIPGKPSNVILRKWLPQSDILAHKNVKLFITHGGQHGILETVKYGVPCVALSVFMDQGANSFRAANLGFAEWIQYKDFTPEKFENAIRKVLSDPRYTQVAKKRSMIMRDKLVTPRDAILFWVDYVVRHEGAEHLKIAAMKLSWYQYLLLDVVLFIITSLILLFYLCVLVTRKIKGSSSIVHYKKKSE